MIAAYADPMFTSLRTVETTANKDGSATTHVVVKCTLADLARAANLRIEDAAFALHECGLLVRRQRSDIDGEQQQQEADPSGASAAGDEEETIVISKEMVEAVAVERNVKRMCMSMAHVLL